MTFLNFYFITGVLGDKIKWGGRDYWNYRAKLHLIGCDAGRALQGRLQPPPSCVTRVTDVAAGGKRRSRTLGGVAAIIGSACLVEGRLSPPTSCSFPWSQLSFQNAGARADVADEGQMWINAVQEKKKKKKEKGAFLTQKESSSAASLESQTHLWWVKYMAHGSGRLRGDLFLKSMPQILFSFFFCSKTCFYDFTKKTRHNRSLQLYILQPAWTLRRSRGARCKYFPLLRSYRKEPSNHQLRPRTIRMLPRFFFFSKPYFSQDWKGRHLFHLGHTEPLVSLLELLRKPPSLSLLSGL